MSFRTSVFSLILADQIQRSFRKCKLMSKIVSGLWAALILGAASFTDQNASGQDSNAAGPAQPLKPPANGKINVAFIISDGADMAMPFTVYTVSDALKPVDAGGLAIVPNYTFENAPKPQVIVIPAQG